MKSPTLPQAPRRRIGGYREYAPPAHLASLLEGAWVHVPQAARAKPYAAPAAHRVIPHFGASLAVERSVSATGEVERARLLFLGPVSRPRLYPAATAHELIALRIHPEYCGALLGVDLYEHWDAIENYADLCPRRAGALLGVLQVEQTPSRLLAGMLAWLAGRLGAVPKRADPGLATSRAVLDHLRRKNGTLAVDALVREHGRSPQYLRRVFRRAFGASPKRIACLLRLEAAIGVADGQPTPDWADLALRFGFCDQAHLARETKRWTGASPTVLHGERRAEIAGSGHADGGVSRA